MRPARRQHARPTHGNRGMTAPVPSVLALGVRKAGSADRPGMPRKEPMSDYKKTLRCLALNDERFLESVLGMAHDTLEVSSLDQKTQALVRLGACLAMDSAPSSYQANVEVALVAGSSIDEIVGTLIAVAPTIGLARAVSAAPELALALGYDVEAAFEALEEDSE